MAGDTFHSDAIFGMGQDGTAYIDGDHVTYNEGDAERFVNLMIARGGEELSMPLDAYHLRELRRAIQRAEKWVNEKEN